MSRGKRRGAHRRGYYWDGLQFPTTAIPTTGVAFELIGPTAQEFMPGTLVRVRGHLSIASAGTGVSDVGLKLMYLEVNDAGTITGDHTAIDTHEEDIAMRQLWTYFTQVRGATSGQPDAQLEIEVDVKAKLKLVASGKWILALLADAVTTNQANMAGYLRCLIMHA